MKKTLLFVFIILNVNVLMAQNVVWGEYGSRTEYRDNAGLQGDAGAISGFFHTSQPVNYPIGASSWWHLLDIRHANPANNYAMQFSGSFFNQDLYFRKTNNDPGTLWSRVILESSGKVGIGTLNPIAQLQVKGSSYFDSSTQLFITNNATEHGRTHLVLTGRFQDNNDGWNFGTGARNAIVFSQNSNSANVGIGEYGIEKYSLQLEGNSNSLGFLSQSNGNIPNMVLTQVGNLGIGTTSPSEKLSVNGKIRAKEIKVETANWPDYVFEDQYKLKELDSLEEFIKLNKHLPGIPSAKEVEVNGINLGEMNAKLLEKIEELTLLMIDMKKEINQLKKQVNLK